MVCSTRTSHACGMVQYPNESPHFLPVSFLARHTRFMLQRHAGRPTPPPHPTGLPTALPSSPSNWGVRVSVVLTLHGTLPFYALSLFSTDPFVSATWHPFDPPGCQPTTSQLTCIRHRAFPTTPSHFLGYNDGLQHPCLLGPSPRDRIRA